MNFYKPGVSPTVFFFLPCAHVQGIKQLVCPSVTKIARSPVLGRKSHNNSSAVECNSMLQSTWGMCSSYNFVV